MDFWGRAVEEFGGDVGEPASGGSFLGPPWCRHPGFREWAGASRKRNALVTGGTFGSMSKRKGAIESNVQPFLTMELLRKSDVSVARA